MEHLTNMTNSAALTTSMVEFEEPTESTTKLTATIFAIVLFGVFAIRNRRRSSSGARKPAIQKKADITTAPPSVPAVSPPELSAAECTRLDAGELIFRPYRNDAGINRGVAVQRVGAPPALVWDCLNDFDAYPRMVEDVCATRVYSQIGADTKVAVSVGYSFVNLTTCLHHTFSDEHQQLTWTLDAERPSSFKFNDGFWLVRPDPHNPSCCLVYYSIAVQLKGWVPSWINAFVAKQGIPRAVAWVKKEAEARAMRSSKKLMAPREEDVMRAAEERCSGPADGLCVAFARCFAPRGDA